jgi:hypothetical protein
MGFATRLASTFSTPIFCIIGILYVDDTDLFAIAVFSSESAEWVVCQMQAMTSHWRGCILVTGGDLNPDKCSWTPIGFVGMMMDGGITIMILPFLYVFLVLLVTYGHSSSCLHQRR